ncbi:hypothetical protein H5410_036420 [Solanum commersonii]|uniref:H(+)-transporting two-sector ATPase n=1 Tax=Solanum commersonii TaxID=4109 RepID=A0A9J5Y7F0_SOLCO|nr:hypothetical protein H5410_036420 [Solanum commersonii]
MRLIPHRLTSRPCPPVILRSYVVFRVCLDLVPLSNMDATGLQLPPAWTSVRELVEHVWHVNDEELVTIPYVIHLTNELAREDFQSGCIWREFVDEMPQLDKFTYFTQFFWSYLFLFTFYIPICNDGDGVLGISRILKLRNQLVSHRENKIRSNDPNSLEDIFRKGFSTGVSYMYSSSFEVSHWCNVVDFLGKGGR